jgi:hypothetical protein
VIVGASMFDMYVTQPVLGRNKRRGSLVAVLSKREFIQGRASIDLSVCWLPRSRSDALRRWNGNGSLESKVRDPRTLSQCDGSLETN